MQDLASVISQLAVEGVGLKEAYKGFSRAEKKNQFKIVKAGLILDSKI